MDVCMLCAPLPPVRVAPYTIVTLADVWELGKAKGVHSRYMYVRVYTVY